jgi:hypothetical protein
VLTDLAAIGAERRDSDQVVTYGSEALRLARETGSGFVGRKLLGLRSAVGTLTGDSRVADLTAEITALTTA